MLEGYLRPDRIVLNLPTENKWKILEILTRVYCRGMAENIRDEILYSILWREMKFSTGLGGSIAIPHGRCSCVSETGLLFCRFKKAISWESIDNRKVNYIFLVIGPMEATEEYLDILSDISKVLSRKMLKKALLETNSVSKIYRLIINAEERKTKRQG
ncbi:MAG: PTS sugar transporter subunit IIA [Candidatus Aureabacteria bacterium]|nr:PTS sugar transporter subunit IIA [Candidatus Auribacterota bacterium]